jgi:hypothetical protein
MTDNETFYEFRSEYRSDRDKMWARFDSITEAMNKRPCLEEVTGRIDAAIRLHTAECARAKSDPPALNIGDWRSVLRFVLYVAAIVGAAIGGTQIGG